MYFDVVVSKEFKNSKDISDSTVMNLNAVCSDRARKYIKKVLR